MRSIRKVAFVSCSQTAYTHRLELGALSYADAHADILMRHFCFSHENLRVRGSCPAVRELQDWKPEGLLLFIESDLIPPLLRHMPRSLPVVSMTGAKQRPGMAFVSGSLTAFVENGVSHLRQQGLRSIAYLALEDIHGSPEHELFIRIARPDNPAQAFFIQPVASAELMKYSDTKTPVVPPPLARWLLDLPKPVGVLCQYFGGGSYLVRACRTLGLRVPDDVAVIGADDADISMASDPPVTSLMPAGHYIGSEAMRVLARMMQGYPAPVETVRLDAMDLHVRQSTAAKRAEICDIAAALEYINLHGSHGILVEEVVRETQHVSRVTFGKYFQAATGKTPLAAIKQRQMEECTRLLRDTELPITVIAEHCGFSDNSSFARSFRAATGISPTDYHRKHHRQKP